MNKNILILLYKQSPTWMSCSKIHKGLIEVYEKNFNINILYLQNNISDFYQLEAILSASQFDAIVCLDYRLSPSKIAHYLKDSNTKQSRDIKFIIHTFGSINKLKNDWIFFSELSKDLNVRIVLPCSEQESIYKKFLPDNSNVTSIVPIPLWSTGQILLKSSKKTKKTTESHRIKIGYAGRLTRLKNIVPMINFLSPYLEEDLIELHIAGPFDDFDKPNITFGTGYYMKEVLDKVNALPNITYHRVISKEEGLYEFLSNLDGFCTLSTNMGEDFCFSVSEALDLGLPCFINNWIALKDHANRSTLAILSDFKTNNMQEIIPSSLDVDKFKDFLNLCKREHPVRFHVDPAEVAKKLIEIINSSFISFPGFDVDKMRKEL